jgi:hypothetical protein
MQFPYESPGAFIELQRALLDSDKEVPHMQSLAGVVRSKCLSLASVLPLSLTSSEMEEVGKNKMQLSQSDLTLQMIKK